MGPMGLYQSNNSILEKLNPITKLLYIITVIALSIIIPAPQMNLACLLASVTLLIIGRVFWRLIPFIGINITVLISIIVIQGLFMAGNKTLWFQIGSLRFYQEGLCYALNLCLRVFNILCAFAILLLTTKPSDLIESLVEKGLSPKLGYLLCAVLLIIPQLVAAMERVMDSQRSRGLETEGNMAVRIKAYLPLIVPVVLSSLINIKEQSMALEVRGFSSDLKKIFLNQQFSPFYEILIQIGLLTTITLALLRRLFLWLS
ncbi:MAG: energy-coupling factor transporter transmembrane protein EcfT [Firmicutes bacterium]|nr:energy-coupling factor transporter transmembrane protein EcfT [Bacillota bacterium]